MSGAHENSAHARSVYVNTTHMSTPYVNSLPLSCVRRTERIVRCLVAVVVLSAALTSELTAQVRRDTAAARTLVELMTLDSTIRLDVKYAT
ncbi:MAG: hypothetical protein H6Q31_3151, partial [Bacteroidetes bacterium]|nr:hypothetical protein [Bacteroidota bacterium]